MSIDYLQDELLINIFHKLPPKPVGICMCVNKHWCSLIKNPSFISSHTTIGNQYSVFWDCPWKWRLFTDSDHLFRFPKMLRLPRRLLPPYHTKVSLCNGVVCIPNTEDNNRKNIILWNPTVKKMVTVPPPNFTTYRGNQFSLGFWFDSLTNDYKVVRVVYFSFDNKSSQIEVYSLNANSWKTLPIMAPVYDHMATSLPILNGYLHWLCRTGKNRVIAGFNVSSEIFEQISLPIDFKYKGGDLRLALYKQSSISVCYFSKYYPYTADLVVWVMKEYGNVESWTKILKFGVGEHPMGATMRPFSGNIIGLRNNGEVLWQVTTDGRVYGDVQDRVLIVSINPETGEEKQIPRIRLGQYGSSFPYGEMLYFEESLGLLDKVDATSCRN